MRVALIGLPTSGKSTVFQALTGAAPASAQEPTVTAVRVPDDRVDRLSALYKPKKTIWASVDFVDLGGAAGLRKESSKLGQKFINAVRPAHALLQVIDAFSVPELAGESVIESVEKVDSELIQADLLQCDKRLERLKKEGAKSGPMKQEADLLQRAVDMLTEGKPLRFDAEVAGDERLRSFSFLTAKPIITVLNTDEDNPGWAPDDLSDEIRLSREGDTGRILSLSAGLESEIASLEPAEAREFLADYGLEQPARERIIQICYDLLGLMSFFTVGEDEVRAWTVPKACSAQDGAATIHSDIARGFIRAEVVDYDTAMELKGFDEAKKAGKMRLEGKSYEIKDGEIISYRFNV